MTDANTATTIDIVDEPEGMGTDLNRQADAFLAANAERRPVTSVREAVREDAGLIRDTALRASERARKRVSAHPTSSVLYALGTGVLLGLILAR